MRNDGSDGEMAGAVKEKTPEPKPRRFSLAGPIDLEPQTKAKANQGVILALIGKYPPAVSKDTGMRIEPKLHAATHMGGPLRQVFELTPAAAKDVRRGRDLVDGQPHDETAVHPIRPFP